ncbi:hypothetical protein A2335_00410, partial [Candidatus Peregrinibacteria bacterium RIFOXYB2_FULL_32_7]
MKTRICFDSLLKQKKDKKISILIGSRQVGKTTLLKELHKIFGGLFLDIDVFSDYEKVSSYENFINTLKINGYNQKQKVMFFVFLDEFQRYEDLTSVLKNIYDNHDNIKIFASGSSSLTIKSNIQESLAGRKHITYIYPLNFEEFLIFQEREDLTLKIKNLRRIQSKNYYTLIPDVFSLLEEFLIFGGYPDVVLAKGNDKKEALKDILDLYIKKELVDYLHIEKIRNCKILMQSLAINNGSITNYSELAKISALDSKTVTNYVEILKETFLINILKPYFSNQNKEIIKAPKIYFLDNGVRNYFCNNFNPPKKRNDIGFLFESFCIAEILKNGEEADYLKYYRTKLGQEVDIILDRISELIAIECKYKENLKSNDLCGLKNFVNQYDVKKAYLINLGEMARGEKINKIDCFNL